MVIRAGHAYWAVALLATAAYLATLPGEFTFDDNFAIISNHDVTSDDMPLWNLLSHDFWGQDIRSDQSHKSYRPVTILVFRWVRQLWDLLCWLFPGIMGPISALRERVDKGTTGAQKAADSGVDPFPFHVLNNCMHTLASAMVLALLNHLFAKAEEPPVPNPTNGPHSPSSTPKAPPNASSKPSPSPSSRPHSPLPAKQQHAKRSRGKGDSRQPSKPHQAEGFAGGFKGGLWQHLMLAEQPRPWLVGSKRAQVLAFVAAAAFALHPVHVEAVAGIVGHAELLCVVLSVPGLLLYFMAVDRRYAAAAAGGATGGTGALAEAVQHWLLVAAAIGLALVAALSKEIGIAMVGAMLVYDVLLAEVRDRRETVRQLIRMVLLMVAGVGYVKLRSWVAGDHLVRIYRKAENPIAFSKSFTTRFLSTGHLHARYFWLLVFPLNLSADWSFNCIPLVETWGDPRNLATLGLYCALGFWTLSAAPFSLALSRFRRWGSVFCGDRTTEQQLEGPKQQQQQQEGRASRAGDEGGRSGSSSSSSSRTATRAWEGVWHARVRLVLVAGLLVGPFFPASNVVMYVGTFIGERLLYFPSIGYCWLLVDLLGQLLLPLLPGGAATAAPAAPAATASGAATAAGAANANGTAAAASGPSRPAASAPAATAAEGEKGSSSSSSSGLGSKVGAAVFGLLVLLLLGGYAGRTWLRCLDWVNEEKLFLSAMKVCPNSCKVQLNTGILKRRHMLWEEALGHFRRAREIEPGYCEPSYWIGITLINMGRAEEGLKELREAVGCKYVASEALKTLNQLYQVVLESKPYDYSPLMSWGQILVGPDVQRLGEGCSTLEDAALLAAVGRRDVEGVDVLLAVCIKGIGDYIKGKITPDSLPASTKSHNASFGVDGPTLRKCVRGRRQLYRGLTRYDIDSPVLRATLYKYLSLVQETPQCRTSCTWAPPPPGTHSSHQKLLHKFQSADPEDPWLQWEWADTLLALNPNSIKEATQHYEVSGALFMQLASKLASGEPLKRHYTALDGSTPLTAQSAAESAVLPLMALKNTTTDPDRRCEALQRMCHLRLQLLVLQQVIEAKEGLAGMPASAPERSSAKKQEVAAKASAKRCLAELQLEPRCRAQALQMAQLISMQERGDGSWQAGRGERKPQG